MNNRAWVFMLPAILLLGFVAIIPLITVLNYSFHDIFTLKTKVWVGFEFYKEILSSIRFWGSFGRSLLYSAIILTIEIPLGIAIALFVPKKGVWVAVCLVCISIPLLIPWNMIPIIWNSFLTIMDNFIIHCFCHQYCIPGNSAGSAVFPGGFGPANFRF